MAFSKITTKGMSGDTLEAGDIAANAVGASELADNAVDTAAIAATSITEAKLNADITDGSAIQTPTKPHIQPGTLYPALHGLIDGDDPSIIDSSATPHVIYLEGKKNIYHSPPNKNTNHSHKSAIKTDGGHSQLRVAGHSDFAFGTGAFTIEMWAKFQDVTQTQGLLTMWVDSSNTWKLSHYSNLEFFSNVGGTSVGIGAARTRTTTWHHFAIVRSGTGSNETKVYVDGTMFAQGTNALNFAAGTNLYLGNRTDNGTDFTTYSAQMCMNMIRIVKGKAVYTGNFAAPTALTTTGGTYSSATNITNPTSAETVLLVNSDVGSHSGAFGTAQSDGRSYYYTDIKGSKPIKDPRIGAHFGSQRHKFKSIQLLEQETATHGQNVYSLDGREWIRGVGGWSLWVDGASSGGVISGTQNDFFEITGYFSSANYIAYTDQHDRSVRATIDGGSESGTSIGGANSTSFGSPLGSRYVDAGSMHQLTSTTLGIHTIKIRKQGTASTTAVNGIELIAQDTSSTANRSKVQIPSQNVVSYGKKFTVSGTPHYNPFDGLSGAKTLTELGTYIDTATSLGMENWKGGTANYYKPFNGGRVVKWVDSSGVIKTSVNMMPPNAQNIGTTTSNAFSDGEVQAGTNDHTITFNTSAVDHSQAEVAKTYHVREFGNGAANGGTGSGSYPDVSMMSGMDDVAYAMDDGLTSISGDDVEGHIDRISGIRFNNASRAFYITFIGTGISVLRNEANSQSSNDQYSYTVDGVTLTTYSSSNTAHPKFVEVAQNLPYGTHILKISLGTASNYGIYWKEFSFHQPKKPPVPEDACILADYMLMADYVKQATGTPGHISKGVRRNYITRDFIIDTSAGDWGSAPLMKMDVSFTGGYSIYNSGNQSADVSFVQLPSFATRIDALGYADRRQIYVDSGSAEGQTVSGSTYDAVATMNTAKDLGLYTFKAKNKATTNGNFTAFDIANPIHSSSHYQEFETPFFKELIGGDRNMEQTNLVVTSDGKSWDEVTRDTSYIGKCVVSTTQNTGAVTSTSSAVVMNKWRDISNGSQRYFNKDFAIAYDRVICLVAGQYELHARTISRAAEGHVGFKINGTNVMFAHSQGDSHDTPHNIIRVDLKRGDYIQVMGHWYASDYWSHFNITRL